MSINPTHVTFTTGAKLPPLAHMNELAQSLADLVLDSPTHCWLTS